MVMSVCGVISWVVGKGCLLWPECSLDKTLLAFALFHFVLQDQTFLLFWVSPGFILLHSNPLEIKRHLFFFLVLALDGVVHLHRTVWLQLFDISGSGIVLDYCEVEQFALGMNQDHSFVFEIAPKYSIWALWLTVRATAFLLRDS